MFQKLAAGVVEGQNPEVGRGFVLPAPAGYIQQKLHEKAADAASAVALVGAQLQGLGKAGGLGGLLEQVLQALAALAGFGDVVGAEEP